MGPAGPLADRLCDLCSGGRGCRARKGWWIVRNKTHTYLVGAPAFMSCGCGGQSFCKAQRPVGSTGGLLVVRLLLGGHSLNILSSSFGLRAGVGSFFFVSFFCLP